MTFLKTYWTILSFGALTIVITIVAVTNSNPGPEQNSHCIIIEPSKPDTSFDGWCQQMLDSQMKITNRLNK